MARIQYFTNVARLLLRMCVCKQSNSHNLKEGYRFITSTALHDGDFFVFTLSESIEQLVEERASDWAKLCRQSKLKLCDSFDRLPQNVACNDVF